EVLLVVVLGVVERPRLGDLRGDLADTALVQGGLVALARGGGGLRLLGGRGVDGRAVLGADVVALAHALGGIVAFPERLQQIVVRDPLGVVGDEDGLGVAGPARAGLLVGGIGGLPARVADRGRDHARDRPELALGAPEAAHAEDRRLRAVRPRRLQRRAVDEVRRRNRHLGLLAGKRLFGGRDLQLVGKTRAEHVISLL